LFDVRRHLQVLNPAQAWIAAFREGLQKLGWTEGRNIRVDPRWASADAEAMQRFAQELVALQPDLILSATTPAVAALLQQTRTIPIVFALVADPVGSGSRASRGLAATSPVSSL
jgi:putative ABC transport system substrate-binding protein